MIYLSGDIHGELEINKLLKFFQRTDMQNRKFSDSDYLIILGDVAVCWDGDSQDEFVKKELEKLPVTVLWLDGNHENFDIIDTLPVIDWHGGKVQLVSDKIIHLMRGYVYNICGCSFFAMGGAFSIDKRWRTPYVSWWPQEMPSLEEYQRGKDELAKVNHEVDFVLTHTVPSHITSELVDILYPGEGELQEYLENEVASKVEFQKWFFGHWHTDVELGKFLGLYDVIYQLNPETKEISRA